MTLSKEGFVQFLAVRLTKESAKSYLDYVDAFSRAVGKDDEYFFTKLDRADEVKSLLQGGINEKPTYNKFKEKYKSNIRTGIRALLKYYLFVEDSNIVKPVAKIPVGMSQDAVLEHYIYSYKMWMKNRLIKLNGDHYKAYEAYANSLKYAILDSNDKPRDFFAYTKSSQIEIFKIKLGDRQSFQGKSKKIRSDITSSINKYKLYLAEKYGEKSSRLYY